MVLHRADLILLFWIPPIDAASSFSLASAPIGSCFLWGPLSCAGSILLHGSATPPTPSSQDLIDKQQEQMAHAAASLSCEKRASDWIEHREVLWGGAILVTKSLFYFLMQRIGSFTYKNVHVIYLGKYKADTPVDLLTLSGMETVITRTSLIGAFCQGGQRLQQWF